QRGVRSQEPRRRGPRALTGDRLVMSALEGRVVAITGASAGIGRALASLLVERGAHVAAFARRADRLAALAADLDGRHGKLLTVPGDVTREDDVQALVDRTVATFG